MTDEELLALVLRDDTDSFRALVIRHNAAMTRVARFHVNSDATAEDVVQETWLAVFRGAEKFKHRSSFKTWLFHILVNKSRLIGTRESWVLAIDPVSAVSA